MKPTKIRHDCPPTRGALFKYPRGESNHFSNQNSQGAVGGQNSDPRNALFDIAFDVLRRSTAAEVQYLLEQLQNNKLPNARPGL